MTNRKQSPTFRQSVRTIQDYVEHMTTDKKEQIALISKAQGLNQKTGGGERELNILTIAKSRIIRRLNLQGS